MRPLILSICLWPALMWAQYPLDPLTLHTIRFDHANGTAYPTHFSGAGSGMPTAFGGVFIPGSTSLSTNAIYVFSDPEDPDVKAFGLKRVSSATNAHLELLLANATGRALRRLRVRARVWQVTEQGRASEVFLRYHRYPVSGSNVNVPGPAFVSTIGPANQVLNPVRKAWIDHTLLFSTPVPAGGTFVIGFQFANGEGSGSNAHMAIEEIRLYPDHVPVVISEVPGWRLLSPPVSGVTARAFSYPFTVQGVAGMDHPTDDPNLFMAYDGTGWIPVPDADTALPPGTGLLHYRYAGPAFEAGVFGHEPTGPVHVPLHASGNGWNLVGNPFATTVRVADFSANGTVSDIVAVWSPGDGVTHGTWMLSSDPILNGLIAPWQGFMVWNDQTSPATTFTIPASAKTTGGTFLKSVAADTPTVIPIELWKVDATGAVRHDRGTQFWVGGRPRVPIPRMAPLSSDTGYLTFEGRAIAALTGDTSAIVRFPVTVSLPAAGLWALAWPDPLPDTGAWHIRLFDKLTGVETAWVEEPRYAFESVSGVIAGRFEVVAVPTTSALNAPGPNQGSANPPKLSAQPNPFNPTTVIRWSIPEPQIVRMAVFDLLGREVAVLADGPHPAGTHHRTFDAAGLSSGLYLVRITTARHALTTRITLVK